MFIVLNQKTGSFVCREYPEQVPPVLAEMKAEVDESEDIQVLCCIDMADESVCMNPRQFMESWGEEI